MAGNLHNVPISSLPVVKPLYHEAQPHQMRKTRFLDRLLREGLRGSPGWHQTLHDCPELAELPGRDRPKGPT